MSTHLIAILGLGLLCAGWAWLQRLAARRHPDIAARHAGHHGCAHCSREQRRIESDR